MASLKETQAGNPRRCVELVLRGFERRPWPLGRVRLWALPWEQRTLLWPVLPSEVAYEAGYSRTVTPRRVRRWNIDAFPSESDQWTVGVHEYYWWTQGRKVREVLPRVEAIALVDQIAQEIEETGQFRVAGHRQPRASARQMLKRLGLAMAGVVMFLASAVLSGTEAYDSNGVVYAAVGLLGGVGLGMAIRALYLLVRGVWPLKDVSR